MKFQSPQFGRTSGLALLLVAGVFALGLMLTIPAMAVPVLFGGQMYYAGGNLTIEVLHSDTVYGEVLRLWSGETAYDVADGSQIGSTVTLTQAQLAGMGIGVGDELRFGIRVLNTNHDFLVGPGSRNLDGLDHAYVRFGKSGASVGFEDLYGGGDRDYNDTIFRFTGVTASPTSIGRAPGATTSVPAPAPVVLLLVGIGALGYAYRKR